MNEDPKLRCKACGKVKLVKEFEWSRRKQRPTKVCRACWGSPEKRRQATSVETTQEIILYYSPIRSLVMEINAAQKDAAERGLPVDRPIASLGDIWVGEMTEEAYREIIRALIRKASSGDVNAAKLLLEERHRRLGEPTAEGAAESFEELFKLDPLTTGRDTE